MTRAAWIKYGLYAASALAGIFAAIFPPAAAVLVPVSTGLAGLATRTPGSIAVPSETEEVVTKPITVTKDAPKPNPY